MKKRKFLVTGVVLALALATTACGSSADKYSGAYNTLTQSAISESYAYDDYDYGFTEEAMEVPMSSSDTSASQAAEALKEGAYSQKLIRTYNFSYETLQFDDSIAFVSAKVNEYGGYIESSEVYGSYSRSAYFKLRIPEQNASAFLSDAGAIGELIRKSETAEDITLDYYDVATRLETLHAQHDRLIELLEGADTLEDIVSLEKELSNVEYEINTYESRKRMYDNLVNYITMYIDINEVTQIQVVEEDTFLVRIQKRLSRNTADVLDGLVELFVTLIAAIPYLIVWAILILIAFLIFRSIRKKVKKGKETKKAEKIEAESQKSIDK